MTQLVPNYLNFCPLIGTFKLEKMWSSYILSICHFVNMPFWQFFILPLATLSICHFVNLPFCQCAFLSICHFVNLPFCQFAILSIYHFVNLPFCQFAILSICHFVNLPFCQFAILSICQFVKLQHWDAAISSNKNFDGLSLGQPLRIQPCLIYGTLTEGEGWTCLTSSLRLLVLRKSE